jgi:hypothetical protein
MSQYNRNTITKNHALNFLWAIVYRILTIIFITISTSSFSQSNFTIEGIVLTDNPNSENISDTVIPVNYVNVILLSDTVKKFKKAFIIGISSDEEGRFKISTKSDKAKFIEFSSLGFNSIILSLNELGNNSFVRVKMIEDKITVITAKPIIYLYPETETSIEIKLKVKGELATTYPKYNNGWQVVASPNGDLTDSIGNKYSYLFWDGYQNIGSDIINSKEGFIVKKDSAIYFLETVLPKLNLTAKERNDFIVYWLPVLERNEYCFVSFYTEEKYNSIAEITTNPKADTEIRVFMWIRPIEKPFETKPQVFEAIERKGFTLVEWGGSVIHHHNLITKYE